MSYYSIYFAVVRFKEILIFSKKIVSTGKAEEKPVYLQQIYAYSQNLTTSALIFCYSYTYCYLRKSQDVILRLCVMYVV